MLLLSLILYISASAFAQCDKIYTKAERKVEFEGGSAAWRRFLERELPVDTSLSPGCINLRFEMIVDTNGRISELRFLDVENKEKQNLNEFKEKILKTQWIPALLEGRKVCYKHIQTIMIRFQ